MCSNPKIYNHMILPCGKCFSCLKRRQNEWVTRMALQRKCSSGSPIYVTLTYNEANLPENGFFRYSDFQKYIKRVRKALEGTGYKIKYFVCGEFGDLFGRPHYHFIIYGLPYNRWSYNLLASKWNLGFSKIKKANISKFRYVAKYCVKSFQKKKEVVDEETGEVFISNEFSRCSNGLGVDFLKSKEFENKLKSGNFKKSFNLSGFFYPMPYSWKKKIKDIYNYNFFENKDKFTVYLANKNFKIDIKAFLSLVVNYKNYHEITDTDLKKVEIKTFEDLKVKVKSDVLKEKAYLTKNKIDFNDFYKKRDIKSPFLLYSLFCKNIYIDSFFNVNENYLYY